ncbi:DUF1822 family protein [Leptothoe spongobia]|uniref:DUF1822 family protein n=1 Tax=Leptothoe spongobia TAU-MAC 1115 TaxID=1967444 RepID=A0A947GJ47_9CYAN|nr:DUF1822 family protein [Leptothoe spongobia]MBT9316239.1 DUF1822 family protein [Leptothoe spongobia TAU-MAC 1115]
MSNPLGKGKFSGLQLPIPEMARCIARQFAEVQPTSEKIKQVQLNTLAVWVTHDYCQMMGIPTDLEQSYSWNPVMRIMANVADLSLPGIGKLECRPVSMTAQTCFVPPEVWNLRVGYVVVEIDEQLQTAQLLGFTSVATQEEIPLSELNTLESLLEHLHHLKQSKAVKSSDMPEADVSDVAGTIVNLSRWFEQTFDIGWQSVGTLLNSDRLSLAYGFRQSDVDTFADVTSTETEGDVRRAKLIDLVVQLGSQKIVLVVELKAETSGKTCISLQVYPAGENPYLPSDLELAVLEPSGIVFMDAQSRQTDECVQLKFNGTSGEHFKVRIRLDEAHYAEEFVV